MVDGFGGSRYEKNSLWKHSHIYYGGELGKDDFDMRIIESHRSPLNRQIQEGVELELSRAKIVMNSKAEWNHARIPRICIEVGEELEEDESSGMARSTEMGGEREKEGA